MSTFHLCVTIKGRSAVGRSTYIDGDEKTDECTGRTFSYKKKVGVLHKEVLLPSHVSDQFRNRSYLWNAVEKFEKRRDSQCAREIEIAFPIELNLEQQIELISQYIHDQFTSEGMIAHFAIHREKEHNPHVHILLTMRRVRACGTKFEAAKETSWNRPKRLKRWRVAWQDTFNKYVYDNNIRDKHGNRPHIDARSYAARSHELGFVKIPTLHVGVINCQREKREGSSYISNLNDKIKKTNRLQKSIARLESGSSGVFGGGSGTTLKMDNLNSALEEIKAAAALLPEWRVRVILESVRMVELSFQNKNRGKKRKTGEGHSQGTSDPTGFTADEEHSHEASDLKKPRTGEKESEEPMESIDPPLSPKSPST